MSASKVDGRQQRSERSRQQIIDAMIQLMNKGIYIPTAQQVANEADISIRTVFRLFSEMDKLFLEIDEVLRPSYESYFDAQDTSGSLEDRIMRAVEARVSCYLEIRALFVATRSLLWRSEILTETYQNNQKRLSLELGLSNATGFAKAPTLHRNIGFELKRIKCEQKSLQSTPKVQKNTKNRKLPQNIRNTTKISKKHLVH